MLNFENNANFKTQKVKFVVLFTIIMVGNIFELHWYHIYEILSLRTLPFLVLKWQTAQNAHRAYFQRAIFLTAYVWSKKLEMYMFDKERV